MRVVQDLRRRPDHHGHAQGEIGRRNCQRSQARTLLLKSDRWNHTGAREGALGIEIGMPRNLAGK